MKREIIFTKHESGATIVTYYPREYQDGLNETQLTFLREQHYTALDRIQKMKSLNSYLKKAYGINLEDYNKLLAKQNEGCSICGRKETREGKRLYVDHDHETGKVRGLLCSGCNSGLGHFEKYKKEMQAYLDAHSICNEYND